MGSNKAPLYSLLVKKYSRMVKNYMPLPVFFSNFSIAKTPVIKIKSRFKVLFISSFETPHGSLF